MFFVFLFCHNIRLLRPVVVTVKHQEDSQAKNDESKDKEEPEEILHIVSEVGSVVLLVALLNHSAFVSKHFSTSRICFCICVFFHCRSLSNSS